MTVTTTDLLTRRQEAIPRGPYNVAPIFTRRAQGAKLWDVEGKEYIDFCGGIGVVNVGHNHPKVVAAIKTQADQFIHTCWHVAMYEPYLELAEKLNRRVPMPAPNKTLFFNSGAEAGENAVKIARAATGRQAVVTFERSFHGRTLLALSMTGKTQPYTRGFGPFAPEVYHLPWEPFFSPEERSDEEVERECRAALDHLFSYHVPAEEIACVIMEPVLGEGGFLPVHPTAMWVLTETCRRKGILFASDEVQAGFARCGTLFACERYEIVPDMVLMAKSIAGGLPLSAVTARAEILDAPQVGGLGGTFGGNPLACAAALAVLEIIEEEKLEERALEIGERVMEAFRELDGRFGHVARPRGLGAMCGLEIVDPATGEGDAARAGRLIAHAREHGLLLMTASGNVLRTLMPLVISDEELEKALGILAEATEAVA